MKGITRCKLTIISESAVCKKFLGQNVSYPASLYICNNHSLECYVVICCYLNVFVLGGIMLLLLHLCIPQPPWAALQKKEMIPLSGNNIERNCKYLQMSLNISTLIKTPEAVCLVRCLGHSQLISSLSPLVNKHFGGILSWANTLIRSYTERELLHKVNAYLVHNLCLTHSQGSKNTKKVHVHSFTTRVQLVHNSFTDD